MDRKLLIRALREKGVKENDRIGGVKLGRKTYSLAYADGMALIAGDEEEMKAMIARLKEYLERKRLKINVKKPKVMIFRKSGRRRKKTNWRWEGKEIEEVRYPR